MAARTGQTVAVWGHSYGGNPTMGGAALTNHVDQLVLYEPSLGLSYPPGSIDAIDAQIEAGDVEAAMFTILIDIAGMTEEQADELRASPVRPARLATAPTIVRNVASRTSGCTGRVSSTPSPTQPWSPPCFGR